MVLAGNEPQPGATWKVTPGNGRRPMRVGMRLYRHGRTDSSAVSAVTGYADDPCSRPHAAGCGRERGCDSVEPVASGGASRKEADESGLPSDPAATGEQNLPS